MDSTPKASLPGINANNSTESSVTGFSCTAQETLLLGSVGATSPVQQLLHGNVKQNELLYSLHLAKDTTVKQRLSSTVPTRATAMDFVFYKQTDKKKVQVKSVLRGRKIETRQRTGNASYS